MLLAGREDRYVFTLSFQSLAPGDLHSGKYSHHSIGNSHQGTLYSGFLGIEDNIIPFVTTNTVFSYMLEVQQRPW